MKLILVALNQELPEIDLLDEYTVKYTGVGKINAAMTTAICLSGQSYYKEVINYGTAGAFNKEYVGKLVQIGTIIQRDMDARPLFPLGQTPFDMNNAIKVSQSQTTLSTGDNFVTSPPQLKSDFVDMEAFAIAKVCLVKKIPFRCYKYITDLADDNAHEDWAKNCQEGAKLFTRSVL